MKNVSKIARDLFSVEGKSTRLSGYVDNNFLIESSKGKYVLKVSKVHSGLLQAQNELLEFINKKDPTLKIQRPVAAQGKKLFHKKINKEDWSIRMLTFVEGEHLAEVTHSEKLMRSLGQYMGRLTKAMQGFSHPEFKARVLEWDLQRTLLSKKLLNSIDDLQRRKKVHYFMMQFHEIVVPTLPELRASVIYGDANDWNVLVETERVTSVIDFGDSVFSQTINELAITLTYALMDKEDPIHWANIIVKGFHDEFPLQEKEIELLYYLIAARLSISVCMSAKSKKVNPANEYITISEKSAWALIDKWLRLNPVKFTNSLLTTCGFHALKSRSTHQLNVAREKYLSKSLSLSYRRPIHMVSGSFQYMFDQNGHTYLDMVNNIMHVGHCHPRVVEAGQRQMARLNTNTRYHYDLLAEYLQKLSRHLPPSLNKFFLVNSGSAASDLAIRLARVHTGRNKIMVMDHGYHGNTMTAIEISPYKYQGKGGFPQSNNIIKAHLPDVYRESRSTKEFISEAHEQVNRGSDSICAFITEPIVGCGGQVPLPKPYLKEVFNFVRSKGGVAIADEVQTGFGRVGTHFWAFEQQGALPDILIMGKPMGNGHPLAAVATTSAVASSFETGMEFFSSFGGNPVSCAIGSAVLDVINEENLQSHAHSMGSKMRTELLTLKNKYPVIGDVRGSGLFLGIELIKNENKEPATLIASSLINTMKNKGVLLSTDGPFNNVIKIKPPMCIEEWDLQFFIDSMDKELQSLSREFK